MEFEVTLRVVAAIAAATAAVMATAKGLYELLMHSRRSLREEYRFAKDFLADMQKNPGMHVFLRDKGLQAIAGSDNLTASEIEYMLTLPEPAVSLKDYVAGRAFVQYQATPSASPVTFLPKWRSALERRAFVIGGFAGYAILMLLAMSPLLTLKPALWKLAGITLPTFGISAVAFLWWTTRLPQADRVVKRQVG